MDDFEIELKYEFLDESADLLTSVEEAFLDLNGSEYNPELLNEIFRLAHNLKGTAKAVGFDELSELTHVAENLILKLKDQTISINDDVVSVLLEFKDGVTAMVLGLKEDLDASFDNTSLMQKIESVSSPDSMTDEASDEENTEVKDDTELSADNSNLIQEMDNLLVPDSLTESSGESEDKTDKPEQEMNAAALESLKDLGIDISSMTGESELVEDSATQVIEAPEQKVAPVTEVEKKQQPKGKVKADETIRVSLSRIDQINNIIGELVILQTVISQRRYEYIQDELTNKSIGAMNKLFKEAQELSMSLRMLPLKSTFQKMSRIVRDTANTLDKNVKLNIIGESTEVDKTVLEKLSDPLVHIIRNAVDHGIEDKEDRDKTDKSKEAIVEIMAFHEGSSLVIQVTDDGKGIDHEVLLAKAKAKGLISENTEMSQQEAIQLIFHPGFSTKEEVTEVSGRGVGMDVVKTNIEKLGGEVKLSSKLGKGTSLRIILPLTLAIIEGVVIRAQDDKFVLPLSQITEMVKVSSHEIESFSGVAQLFKLRGEVIPLFFLNKKINKKIKESEDYTLVIVRSLSNVFGVVIDDVVNQQQIVIKKLGADLQGQKGVMGSAIMSDGMPSIILDLNELFRSEVTQTRKVQRKTQNFVA